MQRVVLIASLLLSATSLAAEPHRSFYELPSSNGWSAVVVDLEQARAHHWRDHLFATEEPVWDAAGEEVWIGEQPQSVWTRDLLFDAYFGLRADGGQGWLTDDVVDLDASGWLGVADDAPAGGTGIVAMAQSRGDLRATTYAFAPWGLERSAMVLLLRVENLGAAPVADLAAFSLHNLHLGEGRPGPTEEIGAENETIVIHDASGGIEERGFAGVTALRALPAATVSTAWWSSAGGTNPWQVVQDGASVDLVPSEGDLGYNDDSVSYLQWTHGALPPGESAWFGLVLAHHGDPFAYPALSAEVDGWVAARGPEQILEDERAAWGLFQAGLAPPVGLTDDEDRLYRHAAVVLRMAQVRETGAYVREWLSTDGEARHSAFGAELPGYVEHLAGGSVLASLPPGQWTYSWPRDQAYAVLGMVLAGMHDEARAALEFLLTAQSGRYEGYSELDGVPVGPYQVSLTRHHGFGIEESDTLASGDFNFEFDSAGLTLWSLGEYTRATGDWTLVEEHWPTLRDEVAGWLVPLVDADVGLIAADSSIWETHWNGKQRFWTWTTATAVRGLCEAEAMAEHMSEEPVALGWPAASAELTDGLLASLRDGDGVLGSNLQEVEVGTGYADAAVVEAFNLGVLDPAGSTGAATLPFLRAALGTDAGPGVARNDDLWDAHELSPWGSQYDADEWVFMDLRLEVALRAAGQTAEADALLAWVRDQSVANYLAIGETYDPLTADYTNNAPMVGFGSGAWIAALHHRSGDWLVEPACGDAFPDEPEPGDDDDAVDDDDATDDDDAVDDDDATNDDDATGDDDDSVEPDDRRGQIGGCGCSSGVAAAPGAFMLVLIALLRRRLERLRHKKPAAVEGPAREWRVAQHTSDQSSLARHAWTGSSPE